MMRVRCETPFGAVLVELPSEAAHALAPLLYSGPGEAVELLRGWLEEEAGAFGHRIGDATTPVDLDAALRAPRSRLFRPVLLEGAELARSYGAAPADRTR